MYHLSYRPSNLRRKKRELSPLVGRFMLLVKGTWYTSGEERKREKEGEERRRGNRSRFFTSFALASPALIFLGPDRVSSGKIRALISRPSVSFRLPLNNFVERRAVRLEN